MDTRANLDARQNDCQADHDELTRLKEQFLAFKEWREETYSRRHDELETKFAVLQKAVDQIRKWQWLVTGASIAVGTLIGYGFSILLQIYERHGGL